MQGEVCSRLNRFRAKVISVRVWRHFGRFGFLPGRMDSLGLSMDFSGFGKILLIAGLILAGLGVLFMLGGKGPLSWIGRLPGDFYIRGERFSLYIPLATGLLISLILTLILWIINRR